MQEPPMEFWMEAISKLDNRPLWPQNGYKSKGRNRTTTREDTIAFNKRVAKRRKKKGYR